MSLAPRGPAKTDLVPTVFVCIALIALLILPTHTPSGFAATPLRQAVEPVPSVDPDLYRGTANLLTPRVEPSTGIDQELPINPDAPPLLNVLESFNFNDNAAATGSYFVPPDPIGAAGPSHLVSVGNVVVEWRDKVGGPRTLQSLQGFFGAPTFTFDPKVIYDQHNDRFVVITLEQTDSPAVSRIYVAVSQTTDPNAGWYTTVINSKVNLSNPNLGVVTDHWADYPGLAVDDGAIYITANMFTFNSLVGTRVFGDSRLWIVRKGAGSGGFYDGGPAATNVYDPSNGSGGTATEVFTLQPSHVFGPNPGSDSLWLTSAGWSTDFGAGSAAGNEALLVIRVDNPLTAPGFSGQFVFVGDIEDARAALPDAQQIGCAPAGTRELPPSIPVETNDRRALHSVWRNGRLYVCSTIAPYLGPDANQATAHWFELDTSAPATLIVNDQGNVGGEDIAPGMNTFFPAIAVDGAGNMAIGFSASNQQIHPGAYYTVRAAGDPPGTVQPTGLLAAGQDCYRRTFCGTRNRWGDYSGIAVDPTDDATFWVFNEYALARGNPTGCPGGDEYGRWGTRWGSFALGQPDLVVTVFEAPCCVSLGEEVGSQLFVRVKNVGVADVAAPFAVGVYVSPDAAITTGDDLLFGGREFVPSLAAGAEVTVPFAPSASIPPMTALGDVYLGVIVDDLAGVTEGDESNNTAARVVHVATDRFACLDGRASSANGPRTVSVFTVPDGSGDALSAAQLWNGVPGATPSIVDATVTAAVRDENGAPVPGVVLDLFTSLGGLVICPGQPASDGPTNAAGVATFSGSISGGGFSQPAAGEVTRVRGAGGVLAEVLYGQTRMLASDNVGTLYEVDLATGAALPACGPFTPTATEIEHNASRGETWLQQAGANFNGLLVDPLNCAPTSPLIPTNGRAFNGLETIGERLWGAGITASCGLSDLYTLDPANGVFTLIGPTGTGPLTGLAWDPVCRRLFGTTGCRLQFGTADLVELDPATGAATPLFNTGVDIGSLEFGPDGRLYAGGGQANPDLYVLDPATGAVNLVGPTGIPGAVTGLTLVSDRGLSIQFNGPDLTGDLVVNLADVGELASLFSGPYAYAIDYVYDGVNNLADIGTFATTVGVGCAVPPKAVAESEAPGAEIALVFDSPGGSSTTRLAPGEVGTAWVIVRGAAVEQGLRAWEAAFETSPNVQVEDWSLAEGSLNVGDAPQFTVGLAAPRKGVAEEGIAVASLRFRVLDAAPAHFWVRATERSSVGGRGPAVAAGEERGVVGLLAPASGSMQKPLARVNDASDDETAIPRFTSVDLRNVPNPFNPATEIRFNLPRDGEATIRIYDLAGRLVRVLEAGELAAGSHTVRWDGRDTRGEQVVSGTYLYRLRLGNEKLGETGKMVLLK